MALITNEEIPAKTAQKVRRTDWFQVESDPDVVPKITFRRVCREDGFVKSSKEFQLSLADIADEQCGKSGLTVAQVAQAIADYFDAKATELKEP